MKGWITTASGIAGLVLGALLASGISRSHPVIHTETRVDTLIIRDTQTIREPYLVESVVLDTVRVYVPTIVHDTTFIALPIEQKHYSGPDYEAWVSGYRASLDSLLVFPETKVITKTITNTITPPKNAVFLSSEVWIGKYSTFAFMAGYRLNMGKYGNVEASLGYELVNGTPAASFRYRKDICTWHQTGQK